MPKAILVMDMPDSCDKCPLFGNHYSDMCCRGFNNRGINYPYPKDFRQKWCPLRYAPSKKYHSMYGHGKIETSEDEIWNRYVDEIFKENKTNES